MLTTLRTGSITLDEVVKYKFSAADKKLIIRLLSDGNHKLWGDINIALTHADAISIRKADGVLVPDYFNSTFKFKRISETELQYEEVIQSGVSVAEAFTALADDGDPIEADVANSSFDLPAGSHGFFLLDSVDSNFSTSTISIKVKDVGKSGVAGVESVFDEDGAGDLPSINAQDLVFPYDVTVSIKDNDAGVTNIPLVING